MHSLDELVTHAEHDLAERHQVDAGLRFVTQKIHDATTPARAAKSAQREVRNRIRAMQAASVELEQLGSRIAYLAAALPFLEEGWPHRRQELEQQLSEDAGGGLAAWLQAWFAAAAWRRVAALERLHGVDGLPPGTSLLLDRCQAAADALEERSWHGCHVLLERGADGIAIGAKIVPSDQVRRDLRLILARLALSEGLHTEAERAIAAAEADEISPATRALRARLQRLAGEEVDADFAAGEEAAADFDVAVELIHRANANDQPEVALDVARAAVDALPVLHDIDAELARIVEEPPAELWTAVAERALRDEEPELADSAAWNAELGADPSGFLVLAAIAEVRAAAAKDETPAERSALLVTAGSYRLWAEQLDAAQTLLEEAVALDAGNVDASLLLADCLIARAVPIALASGERHLRQGIDLVVAAQDAGEITPERSWSYLTESSGRQALAQHVRLDRRDELWRAALAAGRALVYAPELSKRWAELSGAADSLQLGAAALELARKASSLAPEAEAAISMLASALTNVGRYDEALATIGDRSTGWYGAIRGYIAALNGDPWYAVRALRARDVDTTSAWATQLLVGALVLADRDAEAADEARRALARWQPRLDEYQGARTVALVQLVLGRPAEALAALRVLPEDDRPEAALDLRGAALLLNGDGEAGVGLLRRAIAVTTVATDLREIWGLVRLTEALAARTGVTLPELAGLHATLAEREEAVRVLPDALEQIASAAGDAVDPSVVEQAKALMAAAVRIARDGPEAAAEVAAQAGPAARELAILSERAAGALSGPEPPTADEPVPEPEPSPAAGIERPIVVEMPRSWFEGVADPVNEHPFFTEYLPAVRAAADRPVPPVNGRVNDDLEPDGFRILVNGALIDRGALDPAFLYVRADALALLDSELVAAAVPTHGTALWRLAARRDAPPAGLAGVLAMTAAEAVAWCIALSIPADVAQASPRPLAGAPSSPG